MLTDERIEELWKNHTIKADLLNKTLISPTVFARAIEAEVAAQAANWPDGTPRAFDNCAHDKRFADENPPVAAQAWQEPVADWLYGRFRHLNYKVLNPNTHVNLYAAPVACPKCGDAEQMYYRDMTERTVQITALQAKVAELESDLIAMKECAKNHDTARTKYLIELDNLQAKG